MTSQPVAMGSDTTRAAGGFHLLSWDRPLLERAIDWLTRDWQEGPLKLDSDLILVPTRRSGRQLRERLAEAASETGSAVLSPTVVTPEFLIDSGLRDRPVATEIEALMAWAWVLREIDLEEVRPVFPVDPTSRDGAWAFRTARLLNRLKRSLAESGLRIGEVAPACGAGFEEAERWEALSGLERRYTERLAAVGLEDPDRAGIEVACNPVLPPGIARVIVLGVPDPMPLAVTALAQLCERVPVEVVVYGPKGGEGWFDRWGRPTTDWRERPVSMSEFEEMVHVVATPAQQAVRARELAALHEKPEQRMAIGLLDPEVRPFLDHPFRPLTLYDPEGVVLRRHELLTLLQTVRDLLKGREAADFGELLRCPLYFDYLRRRMDVFPIHRLLEQWDRFREAYLPETLDDLLEQRDRLNQDFPLLARAVEEVAAQLGRLESGPVAEALAGWLETVFQGRRLTPHQPEEDALLSVSRHLMELLGVWRGSSLCREAELSSAECLDWILGVLGEERYYPERPAGAIDLEGWLELLWEDAAHLVVIGLNEGRVPESIVGDPFLPESLRTRLGLPNNARRLARDLYLFQALMESRQHEGQVDCLVGKMSVSGDPLRPSRLLLQAQGEALVARVRFLFQEVPESEPREPWQLAWRLRPRPGQDLEGLSVTQFKDYLECPFRFYLRHILKMEPIDPRKSELDPREFGQLAHTILQAFAEDPVLRDSAEVETIRLFVEERLEAEFRQRFGRRRSLPLQLQQDALRQRLRAFAERQAEQRAAGWRIETVEWAFGEEGGLEIAGRPIRGKIDRIDRHESSGAVRVLDYKTADAPADPAKAHYRSMQKGSVLPGYARFEWRNKPYEWLNLQLPLYIRVVERYWGRGVECGYFNLPKATTQTGVQIWDDFDPELVEAALHCAEGVVKDVRARRFWPARDRIKPDPFERLFFPTPQESVDEAYFQEVMGL